MVILCVAPSPAWDVTYHVDRLVEHATNRVLSVTERAGGKAVNVARVLRLLDEPVVLLTALAGATGGRFAEDVGEEGIEVEVVASTGETRRTLTVVSERTGDATVLTEPARLPVWDSFVTAFDRLLPRADVVVVSGGAPVDAPVDGFAELVWHARGRDVPIVVDTSGPALSAAFSAGPTLVKPNLDELSAIVGTDAAVLGAGRRLVPGPTAVAVSRGAEGLTLMAGEDEWSARLPMTLHGNPTGAGDAVVAGFARGLRARAPWPQVLRDAVALGGAAVLSPQAGVVVPADHHRLTQAVHVQHHTVDEVAR